MAEERPEPTSSVVLILVMKALPRKSRIRRYNAITTSKETHILPSYLRLYEEDVATLDRSIASTGLADFTWFLYSCKFGQRKLLETGQSLGPGPFGLDDGYDLNTAMRVSLHLALNFSCIDNSSSLFWSFDETKRWMCGESPLYGIVMNFSYLHILAPTARGLYPLFGLTELSNFTKDSPKVPALDAAFGNSHPRLTYCQCYSPFIEGLEKPVPLLGRPNLVTYLLGKAYISQRSCFKEVWGEVSTRRTQRELQEKNGLGNGTTACQARTCRN